MNVARPQGKKLTNEIILYIKKDQFTVNKALNRPLRLHQKFHGAKILYRGAKDPLGA